MAVFALFFTTIAGHSNGSKIRVGLIPGDDAKVLMIPQGRQKEEIRAQIAPGQRDLKGGDYCSGDPHPSFPLPHSFSKGTSPIQVGKAVQEEMQ